MVLPQISTSKMSLFLPTADKSLWILGTLLVQKRQIHEPKKNDEKARFHRFVFAYLFIAAKSYIHLICFNSNFDS